MVSPDLLQYEFEFLVFNATSSNISAISWRPVSVVEEAGVPGENKQLVNFITCDCESSAPFSVIHKKLGANPRRIGDRLVVRSNDLTHEPPGPLYCNMHMIL